VGDDGIEIGPLPKGTPVGLLANFNLLSDSPDLIERARHDAQVLDLLLKVKKALKDLPRNAPDEEATRVLKPLVGPRLEFSKCPDLVVNRGHYLGPTSFRVESQVLATMISEP
jgi:hypothetical protein